jgi:LysM repeat protein
MIFKQTKTYFFVALLLFSQLLSANISEPKTKVDSLLTFAHAYLKTPYRGGGTSPAGFDCSGFTSFVYSNFGYKLNRSSGSQVENGVKINRSDLRPGDLVFFKGRNASASRIGHVGIVTSVNGDGTFSFIHSAVQTGVVVSQSQENYYARRYVTACRVIENNSVLQSTPLFIPADTIQTLSVIASADTTTSSFLHMVEKGQTLYSIARQYGCTVQDLKDWNGLSSEKISLGQWLQINSGSTFKSSPEVPAKKEEISTTYKVRKGDTLYSIANKYNCSVKELQKWNNLSSQHLQVGQKLTIKK